MKPRWHILLGIIFSLLFWMAFPRTKFIYILLIFLSSVFIDLDHYINASIKMKNGHPVYAFTYYTALSCIEKDERKRRDYHFMHTIEFHLLIAFLGLLWIGFFYILLGMLFHSAIDIITMRVVLKGYKREFLLINWLRY